MAPTIAPSGAARPEVESVQTVPAIRHLVVEINGRRYATGADGTVAVAPEDRHGAVTVVGIRAQPALLQATFTGWADGSTAPTRALDEVAGPVPSSASPSATACRCASGSPGTFTPTSEALWSVLP